MCSKVLYNLVATDKGQCPDNTNVIKLTLSKK